MQTKLQIPKKGGLIVFRDNEPPNKIDLAKQMIDAFSLILDSAKVMIAKMERDGKDRPEDVVFLSKKDLDISDLDSAIALIEAGINELDDIHRSADDDEKEFQDASSQIHSIIDNLQEDKG